MEGVPGGVDFMLFVSSFIAGNGFGTLHSSSS
jgi:hypothetical protein